LMNIGVKRQNVKFNALVYHLYHSINDRANLQENDSILKQTVNKRLSWCEHGLDQYLVNKADRE